MTITVRSGLAPQWLEYKPKLLAPTEGEAPADAPADTGPPVRFQVRPLTQLETVDFRNEIYESPGGEVVATGRAIRTALGAVLQWEGVLNGDGKALRCTDSNKERLPTRVLQWLAWEVFTINVLQELEKKTF